MFSKAVRSKPLLSLLRFHTGLELGLSRSVPNSYTRKLCCKRQGGPISGAELLQQAEKWKSLFDGADRTVIDDLLKNASGASNCKDAQYQLGSILMTEDRADNTKKPEVSNTASQVREDIAKIRKRPSIKGGSRADFEKAKKLRDEKSSKVTGGKILVVDSGVEARWEAEKKASLKTDGVKWIELAASQGHAQAQCFLGNELLRKGLDTADLRSAALKTSDVLAAKEWYEVASRAGCAEASFNLGVMLHDGVSVDPPTLLPTDSESASAEQSSRASTKAASTAAQEEGKGTSVLAIAEDLPRSLTYFELAARQGEAAASLWCGYCFSTGEGGAEAADQRKAEEHLRAAAAETQTAAKANFYLAQLHRPGADHPSAAGQGAFLHHLRLAVDLGDEDGQYTLADLHLKAHFSHADEEDLDLSPEERAFAEEDCRLRRSTTTSTTASVCGDVGHVHGEHCAHDHHHEHHHHHHQHLRMQAGDAGESGQGHLERAVELLRAASAAGHASATLTLGALVYQGLVQCDPAAGSNPKRSAFELYNLAAEQGSLEAWRNIASMHFLGDGVPKCESTAREIMRVIFAK